MRSGSWSCQPPECSAPSRRLPASTASRKFLPASRSLDSGLGASRRTYRLRRATQAHPAWASLLALPTTSRRRGAPPRCLRGTRLGSRGTHPACKPSQGLHPPHSSLRRGLRRRPLSDLPREALRKSVRVPRLRRETPSPRANISRRAATELPGRGTVDAPASPSANRDAEHRCGSAAAGRGNVP